MLLVVRFGVESQEVEDAVQEAFAVAAIHWPSFEVGGEGEVGVERRRWLGRILCNTAARFRDRQARRCRREGILAAALGEGAAEWSPREIVSARELIEKLEGATSAERWRAWQAYELDGVTVDEIARREGSGPPTIYQRLEAARRDLARAMDRERAVGEGPMVRRGRSKRKS